MPSKSKTNTKPLENQQPSYQRGKKMSENYMYTDFGHDKIIIFKSFLDEYSYNTPYLQHCTDKKNSLKTFFLKKFSSAAPNTGDLLLLLVLCLLATVNLLTILEIEWPMTQHEHDDGIHQWLCVKPWMHFIGQCDSCHIAPEAWLSKLPLSLIHFGTL